MRTIIYFIFIFIVVSSSLYSKTLFIEASALVNENYLSESSADVVYNYLYTGNKVYVYNFSKNDRLIIENVFSDIHFINKFQMFFYKIFLASRSIFYASSEREIKHLEKNKHDYIQVYFGDKPHYNIDTNSLLKLENIYGKKLLLAYEVREYINIEIAKNKIVVIDGDTIKIGDISYRLLGIDAPEIAQEYGDKALNHLKKLIENANSVSISPSDFDIYGRILAHLYINNIPVAYSMIENKLAFQTITSFGDNGFSDISSNILERARKQGRMPFLNPDTYRERVKKGETNKLTVKKQTIKKTVVKKQTTKKSTVVKETTSKKPRVSKTKTTIYFIDNTADVDIVDESDSVNSSENNNIVVDRETLPLDNTNELEKNEFESFKE